MAIMQAGRLPMRYAKSFTLIVDGNSPVTLEQFIADNSAPDVTPLEESDIEAVRSLKVGASHTVYFGGGGTIIERVS